METNDSPYCLVETCDLRTGHRSFANHVSRRNVMSAFVIFHSKLFWLSALVLTFWAVCNLSASAVVDPPINRFEDAVRAYEAEDAAAEAADRAALASGQKLPQPDWVVLAIGSSTLAHWGKELETALALPGTRAINRGFGGSTIPELTHYAKRLVCKHRPDQLLVYAGSNDVAENGHSGERVFADYLKFVREVHACSPDTEIDFISMSVAPCRVQFLNDYRVGNELIRDYSAKHSYLRYIDVTQVMDLPDGMPKSELFNPLDNLHMNAAGYALWLPILQSAVRDAAQRAALNPRRRRRD
jgi:lysophospholipase L1-like esterase